MGKLATVIAAPIKGALGTEINVGDTVMVVTTGYSHRVSVSKGVYKGYIQGSYYDKRARIEVEEIIGVRYWKDTGDKFKYGGARETAMYTDAGYANYHKVLNEATIIKQEPYTRKTTLNLNRIATITEAEADTVAKVGKLV